MDGKPASIGLRGFGARLGVVALNLITPGLGLLRVGNRRAGVWLLFAPFALIAAFTLGMGYFPVVGYGTALLALALALAGLVAIYVLPMALTWRDGRERRPLAIWQRWYSLTATTLLILLPLQFAKPIMEHFYKGYYLPSESMAPALDKLDKITVDMRWRGPLKRGGIILFRGPDNVRISRIAGLAGDRIAMRHGIPIVNGVPAAQHSRGSVTYAGFNGVQGARMLEERLPGEAGRHRILDVEPSQFDDAPERLVPPGHLFVLGDNRDRSADSRVPSELFGVGMVPLTAIIGRPLRIYWSGDHGKIGTRLDG